MKIVPHRLTYSKRFLCCQPWSERCHMYHWLTVPSESTCETLHLPVQKVTLSPVFSCLRLSNTLFRSVCESVLTVLIFIPSHCSKADSSSSSRVVLSNGTLRYVAMFVTDRGWPYSWADKSSPVTRITSFLIFQSDLLLTFSFLTKILYVVACLPYACYMCFPCYPRWSMQLQRFFHTPVAC
jgi:hypothetical protein